MIVDIATIFLLGLVIGIVVGLIPGVSIWTSVIFMLPFLHILDYWDLIIIWLGSRIGSQYFGSVAAFLLKVPGENSTLVFFNDIDQFTSSQRIWLIKATAVGSFVATLLGFAIIAVLYKMSYDFFVSISSNYVMAVLFAVLVLLITLMTKHKNISALLFAVGFLLAEKTDDTIPQLVYNIQYYTSDITPFSLMLGLLIIPEIFFNKHYTQHRIDIAQVKIPLKLTHYWSIFKGSVVGLFTGLIPGQAATTSAILAYNLEKSTADKKIIASESADNSAVITGMLPLFLLGIPMSLDAILLVNLLDIQLVEVPTDFFKSRFYGLNTFELVVVLGLIYSVLFFILSQKFLSFYALIFNVLFNKSSLMYGLITVWIIWVDHQTHAIGIAYFGFLILISMAGIYIRKQNITPIPLLFGFLLGDQMYWSYRFIFSTHL